MVDVHAAIYDYLQQYLGIPGGPDQYGLLLFYEPPRLENGDLFFMHYLVVRDGLITRERWSDLGGRREQIMVLDRVELCDPSSLELSRLRELVR